PIEVSRFLKLCTAPVTRRPIVSCSRVLRSACSASRRPVMSSHVRQAPLRRPSASRIGVKVTRAKIDALVRVDEVAEGNASPGIRGIAENALHRRIEPLHVSLTVQQGDARRGELPRIAELRLA